LHFHNNKNKNARGVLMLPRRLYEILPHIYIITGVVSALLIHSRLVIIAAMLMIMAGVIILSMRISNRRSRVQQRTYSESGHIGINSRPYIERSGQDRRHAAVTRFPLIDSAGKLVECDRRLGDRRLSAA
jgi:hypothetical protein